MNIDQHRFRLYQRFRQQQRFAADSSPLTACLCEVVAQWLDQPWGEDELADWLVDVTGNCSTVAVPMLLLAALHRVILTDDPCSQPLAAYFPTVGGRRPAKSNELQPLVRQVILANRQQLSTAFTASTVQTNESSRGLCWLLPLLYTGWPTVHLVDLGCSAGLNLVADLRKYRLCGTGSDDEICLGQGRGEQFIVSSNGKFVAPMQRIYPQVLSRIGCDRQPLLLETEADELWLGSFVWGDQVHRLHLLRQGIEAMRSVEQTVAPVRLVPADLPTDLEAVLDTHFIGNERDAVILYNTYLTSYLSCKGRNLAMLVSDWAQRQKAPVLWLQWEPMRQDLTPPAIGWLAWTAHLWMQGEERRWHLAWVHPHGTSIMWLPDLIDWYDFWCKSS